MNQSIRQTAATFVHQFGGSGLAQARALLEDATAARDHQAAVYWADVCTLLSTPQTLKPLGSRE